MNKDEVLELVRAGFTKDEIKDMLSGTTEPAAEPEKAAEPEPAKEPEKAAEPETTTKKETGNDDFTPFIQAGEYKELLDAMKNLTAGIVKMNINKDGFDSNTQRTAESALAEIIRPTKKG